MYEKFKEGKALLEFLCIRFHNNSNILLGTLICNAETLA